MTHIPTASQTVGPFFRLGLTTNAQLGVVAPNGIHLQFRVTDGDGLPTPGDSMIEIWQADAHGHYPHPLESRNCGLDPAFCGFGRLQTDANGICVFETVKPGAVPQENGDLQAPHINVTIFARGLGKQLRTRVYFDGEAANADDPVLALVPADRRQTLLAKSVSGAANDWSIEIRLQGDGETVFFDV
jgi:protocatechuate 3,4-dioxygenase, alpha subunit